MSKEIAANSAILFLPLNDDDDPISQKKNFFLLSLFPEEQRVSIYMIILFYKIGKNQNKKILFQEIINKNVDLLQRLQQKSFYYYSPFSVSKIKEKNSRRATGL